jgi:hypothetical protein
MQLDILLESQPEMEEHLKTSAPAVKDKFVNKVLWTHPGLPLASWATLLAIAPIHLPSISGRKIGFEIRQI